ncbi:MAG: hypothetical protein K6B74_09005 [Ruminococcus sp.]|nr:hypothetical protein [Ruminococcus sp.]
MIKSFRKLGSAALAALLLTAAPLGAFADDSTTVYGVKSGTFTYLPYVGTATDTYYYSDNYFNAADGENKHLAAMSMALTLSVMENHGAALVTDLLTDIGFKDISHDDMDGAPARDTIGSAIAHKTAGDTELIAVAIRGGSYEKEWASNLTAGTEGSIKGFDDAKEKVLARLKDYIKEHDLKNVKIWITGYSRAGAVADLAGAYIDDHPEEFGTSGKDLFVYTFESPRASADPTVYDNIFNYRNKNDLVNYVYPEEWGICSCGKDVWFGTDETLDAKVLSLDSQKIITDGVVSQDEFCRELAAAFPEELTREKYSGDFDKAVGDILETAFGKSPDERQAALEYIGSIVDLSGGMAGIAKDPALLNIVLNDIISGVLVHDTDKAYEKLADDMSKVIADKYAADVGAGKKVPLTDDDMTVLLDSLYPVLRRAGEVIVRDYYNHDGIDAEKFFPEGYRGDTQSEDGFDGFDGFEDESDYGTGYSYGRNSGENAGARDAAAHSEYLASFDDTPVTYGSQKLTDEYAEGWKDGYALGYDDRFTEKPLYHIATFAANAEKILGQHEPALNWEMIKLADDYYSGKYTFTEDDPRKSDSDPSDEDPRNTDSGSEKETVKPAADKAAPANTGMLTPVSYVSTSGTTAAPAAQSSGEAAPASAPVQTDGGTAQADTASAAPASAENNNPPTGGGSSVCALIAVLSAGILIAHRRKG